jgi:hypothetical protein
MSIWGRVSHFSRLVAATALVGGMIAEPSFANSVSEFYQDKQITLIIGADVGAGYDAQIA